MMVQLPLIVFVALVAVIFVGWYIIVELMKDTRQLQETMIQMLDYQAAMQQTLLSAGLDYRPMLKKPPSPKPFMIG